MIDALVKGFGYGAGIALALWLFDTRIEIFIQ